MQPEQLLGFDAEELALFKIFHPHALTKTLEALRQGARFVHYTNADTALKIICNEEVWMRKSTCMNDFMEIEHGFDCLKRAYSNQKAKFISVFDSAFPDFSSKLEERFNAWLPSFRNSTYISCISEHDASEDPIGRLSMWRAYGGPAGVALVVHGEPFLRPSDALNAFASPVAYLSDRQFELQYEQLLQGFEDNFLLLRDLGEDQLLHRLFEVFRLATLCTKHPGFAEEREWRIIYSPSLYESAKIRPAVFTFNGVPQKIYKIPLKNVPEEGLYGIEVAELVERVIVGPTQFPLEIREALAIALSEKGVSNSLDIIYVSDIPLRN